LLARSSRCARLYHVTQFETSWAAAATAAARHAGVRRSGTPCVCACIVCGGAGVCVCLTACQFQVLSSTLGRPAADAGGRLRARHYGISIYGPSTGRGGATVRVHAAPDFKFHGCESWRGRSAAAAAASRRSRGPGALQCVWSWVAPQRRRYSAMARNFAR